MKKIKDYHPNLAFYSAIFGWQILLINGYLFSTKEMLTLLFSVITINEEEL